MSNRDVVADLADRIEERRRRAEDFDLQFEIEWYSLTTEEQAEFVALVRQRTAQPKCWPRSRRTCASSSC